MGIQARGNNEVGGEYDPIKDIIEINNVELISADVQRPELLRLLVDNLEKTAYHEAFHRVQFNFLKPEELKVFNQYLAEIKLDFGSRQKEQQMNGQAVQIYCQLKKLQYLSRYMLGLARII
jgi:hypothetical protein